MAEITRRGILVDAAATAIFAQTLVGQSRALAQTERVAAEVGAYRTAGYAAPGDGGSALYQRRQTEPAHPGKFRSADGAWWELVVEGALPIQALGVLFNDQDETDAWVGALEFARLKPGLKLTTPPGRSYCRPNALILSALDRKPIHSLTLTASSGVADARQVGDSVLDFSRGGRATAYPASALDWAGYDYGFRGLASDLAHPEQSGVNGFALGLTIVPPAFGVGMMITHGRNIDLSNLKVMANQPPGRFPQYGVVLDKCIAVQTGVNTTIAGIGYHRFGLFLFPNTGLDRGANLYNDSIFLEGLQFGGAMFACIADWGSQSEGVRVIRKTLQSGQAGYHYIVGQVDNLTYADNWTENCQQAIWSPNPATVERTLAWPTGAPPAGVEASVRIEDVVPLGVTGGNAQISNVYLAYARRGFEMSIFKHWKIGGVTINGATLGPFAMSSSMHGAGEVEMPHAAGGLAPNFVLAQSPYASIATRGVVHWAGRESCHRDDAVVSWLQGRMDPASVATRVVEERLVQFITDRYVGGRLTNYPVLALDYFAAGPMSVRLSIGGASPGSPVLTSEVLLAFGADAEGRLALLGAERLLHRVFDGSAIKLSTLPEPPSITVGFIRNTRQRPPTIFLGIAVPRLMQPFGGLVRLEMAGAAPGESGRTPSNACYLSRPVMDYLTASAAIAASGRDGASFFAIRANPG